MLKDLEELVSQSIAAMLITNPGRINFMRDTARLYGNIMKNKIGLP